MNVLVEFVRAYISFRNRFKRAGSAARYIVSAAAGRPTISALLQ
jgi:hypothetical protein